MVTSIIAGVVSILALLLKAWFDNAPERKVKADEKSIQDGRSAIAGGDSDAVSGRIDGILLREPPTNSDLTGSEDGKASSGSTSSQCGVADLGQRVDKITGAS
jgi:hypothetical protein